MQFSLADVDGPTEVGISAGALKTPDDAYRLQVYDEPTQSAAWAYDAAQTSWTENAKRLFACAAFLCVKGNWMGSYMVGRTTMYEGHAVKGTGLGPLRAPDDVTSFENKISSTLRNLKTQISTIVLATKVNYWQMNHHIGQPEVTGYVKKAIRICFKDEDLAELGNMCWIAGHWVSTKGFLKSIGVRHVVSKGAQMHFPRPSVDMKLRFNSAPAGTARYGFVNAVIKKLDGTAYPGFLPLMPQFRSCQRFCAQIHNAPAKYHLGAQYLTGRVRNVVDPVDDDFFNSVCAIVHGAFSGSTLAKAGVCAKIDDVRSDNLYAICTSVKRVFTVEAISVEKIKARLKLRSVKSCYREIEALAKLKAPDNFTTQDTAYRFDTMHIQDEPLEEDEETE